MSLKPVSSLKFKRDCFEAWKRKVADGYTPEQIIHAYDAYAKAYWMRNADDKKLAKNLIRWLEGEEGLRLLPMNPYRRVFLDTMASRLPWRSWPMPTRISRLSGTGSKAPVVSCSRL